MSMPIKAEVIITRTLLNFKKKITAKLEIKIKTDKQTVLNRLQIMKLLSVCCERDFDIPSITKLGNYAVITATESLQSSVVSLVKV